MTDYPNCELHLDYNAFDPLATSVRQELAALLAKELSEPREHITEALFYQESIVVEEHKYGRIPEKATERFRELGIAYAWTVEATFDGAPSLTYFFPGLHTEETEEVLSAHMQLYVAIDDLNNTREVDRLKELHAKLYDLFGLRL